MPATAIPPTKSSAPVHNLRRPAAGPPADVRRLSRSRGPASPAREGGGTNRGVNTPGGAVITTAPPPSPAGRGPAAPPTDRRSLAAPPTGRRGLAAPRVDDRGPAALPVGGCAVAARPALAGRGNKFDGGRGPRETVDHDILFQKFFKSVGPRTYAAQVKRARNGNHYLVLTDGQRDEKTGDLRKSRVFVYSEDFVEFFRLVKAAAEFIKEHPVSDEVRRRQAERWARPGPLRA